MTTTATRLRTAAAAAVLGLVLAGCAGTADTTDGPPTGEPVTSGMCAEGEPDCDDTPVSDVGSSGAAGSCLAGDPDCTDESYGGQDVTRPVPLVAAIDDIRFAARGATSGATGRPMLQATLVDDDTLQLVVRGSPCMLIEDVVVTESPAEVRVLVLGGRDAAVETCQEGASTWAVEVDLDAPLGDRALLDLAG